MPNETLKSVVKSVNFMSRQLLADLNVHPSKASNPEKSYYQAICAVTTPAIPSEHDYARSNNESVTMDEIKRIKRHQNVSKMLNS